MRAIACGIRPATIMLLTFTLLACRHSGEPSETITRQRIISLSPGITEILYGVGAFSSLVADTEYCDFPEEAKRLPHVGGFAANNLEAIAGLKPDLVILIEDQALLFKDKLDQMSLRVLVVKSKTVAEIIDSIRIIGRETGHQAEGERLAEEVSRRIEDRKRETANLPRLRVLCAISYIPGTLKDIYTATAGSFLDELITASGGQNIAPPNGLGYSKIQQEAIVDANPQIIIDTAHKLDGEQASNSQTVWQALPQIDAVKNGQVIVVGTSVVAHPSQRIVEALDIFSRMIHPEVFGHYDQ